MSMSVRGLGAAGDSKYSSGTGAEGIATTRKYSSRADIVGSNIPADPFRRQRRATTRWKPEPQASDALRHNMFE
jgi:hypothetical protein